MRQYFESRYSIGYRHGIINFQKYFIQTAYLICIYGLIRPILPLVHQVDQLHENRGKREQLWQRFIDDMNYKQLSVQNTFEEKEEELRECYSDLEQKLVIQK